MLSIKSLVDILNPSSERYIRRAHRAEPANSITDLMAPASSSRKSACEISLVRHPEKLSA